MQTPSTSRYLGVRDAFKKILQEEGIGSFYRGLGTNLLRITPAAAITLVTYELLMRSL